VHTFQATRYLIAGQVPGPSGNHHPTVAPYGMFDAADGPLVIAVGNEDIWRRFAPLVGLEPADRRFATNAGDAGLGRWLTGPSQAAGRA
jgi:formyl-CoA transferase